MFAFAAFTFVCEHEGRFLSSGMSLRPMRRLCAYVVFALYLKLCQRGVAWRSSNVAFLLVPLPSSTYLILGLPPPSRFFPFVSGICSFYFQWASGFSVTGAILGGWIQCDGCYIGGLGGGLGAGMAGGGDWGLVTGLWVCRPVGVLLPWAVIAVAAPWPMVTQPPLAARALTHVNVTASYLL